MDKPLSESPVKSPSKKAEIFAEKPETSGLRRSGRSTRSAEDENAKQVQALIDSAKRGKKQATGFLTNFGGVVTIIFSCAFFLVLPILCTKTSCTLSSYKTVSLNWRSYIDRDAILIYLGFVALQLLLALLPIGQQVDGPPMKGGRHKIRTNGFFAAVSTLVALGALYYFQAPLDVVYQKFIPICIAALGFGGLLSIVLYFTGGRAAVSTLNPAGNTGSFVLDLLRGRQIAPVWWGRVNVKFVFHRVTLLALLVLNVILLLKKVDAIKQGSALGVIFACGAQIWYALDYCYCEEQWLHSFEYQRSGTGFHFIAGCAVWPFLPSVLSKFVVDHNVELSWYVYGAILIVHNFGWVIYRASSSQKAEFRKNPLKPSLSHLETIPTSQGKKLLVSGWFGWIRHPNYLGVFIMHLCWVALCGNTHILPLFFPLLTLLIFVEHSLRVDLNSKERYGAAWERYCGRVKKRLIPGVF